MNKRLALLPLLLAHVFAHADEAAVLPQVEVAGSRNAATAAKSYSVASDGDLRDRVNLGLLGKANAFTAPISVANYDEQAIAQTEARTLVDALAKKDASTWQFGGETNTLQGLYVRGYQLDARQFSVNGLAGMYAYQSSPSAAVASAQLIKGASTALGGMDPEGAVSGAVNIETKKAADEGNRSVGLGWFSDSRVQAAADFGQRFGADKQFGVRLNSKLRRGDTPRQGYEEDNKEFALNADYRGEALRLAWDSMYSKRKTTGGRARFHELQNLNFNMPAAPDGRTNLVPAWQAQTTRDETHMFTLEYDAFERARISGGIGYSQSRYSGNFAQLTMLGADGRYRIGSGRNGSRLADLDTKTLSLNLAARGSFDTGPVSHNWSAAYDRVKRNRKNHWGSAYTAVINTHIYHPVWGAAPTLAPLSATPAVDTEYTTDSIALSDTLGFMDDKIRLTVGGRMQRVAQHNKLNRVQAKASRFSPMLMAAWLPSPDWVIYGNYMEDLEPGTVDETTGQMADPRVSRQVEIGTRKNWGDWVTSLSAFQISRPGYWRGNTVRGTDFAASGAKAGAAQGRERNSGLELNVYGNLFDKTLRPRFGLMYLHSALDNYPTYADNLVNGVQVANPRVAAKAGIEWDTPFAKGLTLSTGLQYIGKSYQRTDKAYTLPSYTLVDAGARYQTKIGGNTLTLSGTVENLFNKKHWQIQRGQYDRSFAVLGMPRTYWLKAEMAF